MPRLSAVARARSRDRDASATTSQPAARCMAGTTLVRAIRAAPSTPHRIVFIPASRAVRPVSSPTEATAMIVHTEYRDLETPTGPMRTHVYAPAPAGAP